MIADNPGESRKEWLLHMFKYFAKLNDQGNENQFWQYNNHPIVLSCNKWIQEKLQYIYQNPVKARLAVSPESYFYSSACEYNSVRLSEL